MSVFNLFTNPEVAVAADKFHAFLEHSGNGVIFFDQHLAATHASKKAVQLYEEHQAEFAAVAPDFNLKNITKVQLRDLTLIPDQVITGLQNNKTWARMLDIGVEKCHVTLTPFVDSQKVFHGAMLEFWWATEYQKLEDLSSVRNAIVQEMSVPIITCDANRIINSMNPAVLAIFTQYQQEFSQLFPGFDPTKLIGKNIDEFHKNPELQKQALVSSHAKMPYQARIRVLHMVFDLTVFPLKDAQGKISGYAAEWLDVTNQIKSVEEIELITQKIIAGQLQERIDIQHYQGDYRKIVEGVNHALDAVIVPLNVAADYVDQISKGNIPAKITDSYNGDFNVLKNNLNTCIDAVNS